MWKASLVISLVTVSLTAAAAQQRAAPTPARSFYPPSDAAQDVAAALDAARKDGKYVLLDFGADWCPDCRVLGALFEDAAVAPLLRDNFHVVRIDVGRRDRNGDLVTRYGATSGDWIPAVVVLDGRSRRIAVTDESVRLTRRTTAAELAAHLRDWAPKARVQTLHTAVESGVRVTMTLDRDRRGGWWIAAEFAPINPDAHLYGTGMPATGIDGLGRPTRLTLSSSSGLRARGPVVADRPIELDVIDSLGVTLPIYPAGPVTLRVPIEFTTAAMARADVEVGYMACTPLGCLRPVLAKRLELSIDRW